VRWTKLNRTSAEAPVKRPGAQLRLLESTAGIRPAQSKGERFNQGEELLAGVRTDRVLPSTARARTFLGTGRDLTSFTGFGPDQSAFGARD
jgi:hypothetical protein